MTTPASADRPLPRPGGALRISLSASSALVTVMLPVFLVGALSDSIRDELRLSRTAIGAAVTVLFVTASVGAVPVSRLVERVGPALALRAGVILAGLATAAIGAFAETWWQLGVPLAAVGLATGMVDTGAARSFADRVSASGLGTAFGIKEASVPAASLLAGVALPTVALQLGWRATFVGALAVAALVLVTLPSHRAAERGMPASRTDRRAPAAPPVAGTRLAIAAAFGAGAATAAATFLVPSATDSGLSPSAAGWLLAAASGASVGVRVAAGRWADREGTLPLRAVALMLVVGAVGASLVAAPGAMPLMIAGAVLVLAGGWGWTGLAFLAIVRARPGTPAAAAAVVLTGLAAGGAFGPLLFGAIADAASYGLAWGVTAAALGLAAMIIASSDMR